MADPAIVDQALADLPDGWFNHGAAVLPLIERHRPRVCVELGTWLGQSAIAITPPAHGALISATVNHLDTNGDQTWHQ